MTTFLVLVVPILTAVVIGGAVLAVVLAVGGRWRPAEVTGTLPLPDLVERHTRLMRALAISAMVAILLVLPLALPALTLVSVGPSDGATGVIPALLPLVVGVVVVGVLLLGERTWPRPTGEVRTAPLVSRTISSTSPTWLRRLTIAWAAGLLALLVTCGIVGDGNTITAFYSDADVTLSASSGPFPGWPYGLPTLAVAALLLALTWSALGTVRRRSAVATLTPAADEELRLASSARLLRVTQAALGLTLAANLFFAGTAIRGAGGGWPEQNVAGPWWGGFGPWLAGLGVVVAIASLLALLPLAGRSALTSRALAA